MSDFIPSDLIMASAGPNIFIFIPLLKMRTSCSQSGFLPGHQLSQCEDVSMKCNNCRLHGLLASSKHMSVYHREHLELHYYQTA